MMVELHGPKHVEELLQNYNYIKSAFKWLFVIAV